MKIFSSWDIVLKTISAGQQDWGGLHPLIVHFPIALLFAAPFLILAGIILKKSAQTYFHCALILMVIATLGLFLAVSTGEEASESIMASPAIVETLETHEHLGEKIKLHFSILTILFFVYVIFYPAWTNKFSPKTHLLTLTFFLVIYAYDLVLLTDTAHQGGKLVHQYGVNSTLYETISEKSKLK